MANAVIARDLREIDNADTHYAVHPLVLMNISDHHTRLENASNSAAAAGKPPSSAGQQATTAAHPPGVNAAVGPQRRAIGVLLGQQRSRIVEIHTSFDLKYDAPLLTTTTSGPLAANYTQAVIDVNYLAKKKASMAKVFPEYEVVGWYTTGLGLTPHDVNVLHNVILTTASEDESAGGGAATPSSSSSAAGGGAAASTSTTTTATTGNALPTVVGICLVVNMSPAAAAQAKHLPVYLLEIDGTSKSTGSSAASSASAGSIDLATALRRLPFAIESEESERIGIEAARNVDQDAMAAAAANTSSSSHGGGSSSHGSVNQWASSFGSTPLRSQAESYHSALSMLRSRLSVMIAYLEGVDAGSIPPDYALLRRISALVNQVPQGGPAFQSSFEREYADALLVSYMSLLNRGTLMLGKLATDVQDCTGGGDSMLAMMQGGGGRTTSREGGRRPGAGRRQH